MAVDLPGYGQSLPQRRGAGYNTGVWIRAIQKVASATGLEAGVLVGWSWGGDLAIQASTQMPDLSGLFVFGTAPLRGSLLNMIFSIPSAFLSPKQSLAGNALRLGTKQIHTEEMNKRYIEAMFSPEFGPAPSVLLDDGMRSKPETRRAILRAATGFDSWFKDEVSILQNLEIPVAIIHPGADAFVNENYLRSLEESIPLLWRGETVVVPESGHILQWEQPETFVGLLQEFLEDIR